MEQKNQAGGNRQRRSREEVKRYGQALNGGVTPFDEDVERHLARYEANRKKMEAKAQAAQSFQNAPPPATGP